MKCGQNVKHCILTTTTTFAKVCSCLSQKHHIPKAKAFAELGTIEISLTATVNCARYFALARKIPKMARFKFGGAVDNQLVYAFESSQDADRFLNRLKRGAIANARAKRQAGGLCIAVQYPVPADATFDNTCQQLDDLAASLGGHEQAP